MKAITVSEGIAVVDREKCIGCGLCVTGCAFESVAMQLKPEEAIIHSPKNFGIWEQDRLKNRGLI